MDPCQLGTSLFLSIHFLALLFLLRLLLTQFWDVDLLFALYHSFGEQLKHIVQVGIDLREKKHWQKTEILI